MIYFWILFFFVILQRITELFIAKRNAAIMLAKGAVETDSKGFKVIAFMHLCFFISLALEANILSRGLNKYWYVFLVLFIAAQILRYWAMISLGHNWNTRIITLKGSGLIVKGPYKYFRHPNYAAVITELAVIPLMFSCFYTAIVFSAVNLVLLKRRIKFEETALSN